MKKALALAVSLCVIATAVIGATYAYRTAGTGDVQNTFSFDGIEISLAETYVQDSVFYPGAEIDKKATVTVNKNSSPCYLYAMVENGFGDAAQPDIDDSIWLPVQAPAQTNRTVYRYHEIVSREDTAQAFDVFQKVTFSEALTKQQIAENGEKTITVGAYAHQASGVDSETADQNATAYFTPPSGG